jgi:hypothetical protein
MAGSRPAFTDGFKAEVVRPVTVEERPARQAAKDLGILPKQLPRLAAAAGGSAGGR